MLKCRIIRIWRKGEVKLFIHFLEIHYLVCECGNDVHALWSVYNLNFSASGRLLSYGRQGCILVACLMNNSLLFLGLR